MQARILRFNMSKPYIWASFLFMDECTFRWLLTRSVITPWLYHVTIYCYKTWGLWSYDTLLLWCCQYAYLSHDNMLPWNQFSCCKTQSILHLSCWCTLECCEVQLQICFMKSCLWFSILVQYTSFYFTGSASSSSNAHPPRRSVSVQATYDVIKYFPLYALFGNTDSDWSTGACYCHSISGIIFKYAGAAIA